MSPPAPQQAPQILGNLETIFRSAHVQIKPRTVVPVIQVEFFAFAGVNHTARIQDGCLLIRISDVFTDAPGDVMHALALILLAKLYRKRIHTGYHDNYRAFILRTEIQERARLARSTRGRAPRQIRGRYADLDARFDRLNQEYFEGKLDRPRLSWSLKRSRRILGRYDATHHTIYISRLFDSPDVPPHVLDYILFHEMLHVKHRGQVRKSRMMVHTPEFKADERSFRYYGFAKLWLAQL